MKALLALGSNRSGSWGSPDETLSRAMDELSQAGIRVLRVSRTFSTRPLGPGLQDRYLNAVVLTDTSLSPVALLRLLKRIERRAGRRLGRTWGPRPLDIDILDWGGRCIGWPARRREPGRLILPHPEMHRRTFVLVPLLDVAPGWRHPALGVGTRGLLARLLPSQTPPKPAKPLLSRGLHATS